MGPDPRRCSRHGAHLASQPLLRHEGQEGPGLPRPPAMSTSGASQPRARKELAHLPPESERQMRPTDAETSFMVGLGPKSSGKECAPHIRAEGSCLQAPPHSCWRHQQAGVRGHA